MVNGQQSTDFVRFFLDAEGLGILGVGILGLGNWDLGIGYTVPELVEGKSSALRQAQ